MLDQGDWVRGETGLPSSADELKEVLDEHVGYNSEILYPQQSCDSIEKQTTGVVR